MDIEQYIAFYNIRLCPDLIVVAVMDSNDSGNKELLHKNKEVVSGRVGQFPADSI